MRCRVPVIYLVDSAGVNLPYQSGVFPGQYGGGTNIFLQFRDAALFEDSSTGGSHGPCVAGGAYLPAL